jgi:hypothetical protein
MSPRAWWKRRDAAFWGAVTVFVTYWALLAVIATSNYFEDAGSENQKTYITYWFFPDYGFISCVYYPIFVLSWNVALGQGFPAKLLFLAHPVVSLFYSLAVWLSIKGSIAGYRWLRSR